MPHEFSLSDLGIRLIKAYEGLRVVETTTLSGKRVIGYGHRYQDNEEPVVTKEKAELTLKTDLEPYEAMVNESVFAPLSQGQFDALVSLAFNIGPKAFLGSRTLHALNQGRPLDAANAFDEWRKSEVNGEIYVVDALLRRRTAEKSLFLRPDGTIVPAPRIELPPKRDQSAPSPNSDISYYHGSESEEDGIVDQSDSSANPATSRRKEDGPAGILTLSERFNEDLPQQVAQQSQLELGKQEPTQNSHNVSTSEAVVADVDMSPIAVAARNVSQRLDKLMAEPHFDSAAQPEIVEEENVVEPKLNKPVAANEGTDEAYARPADRKSSVVRGPDAFIQRGRSEAPEAPEEVSIIPYWIGLFVGLALGGFGIWKWFFETPKQLDDWMALAAPAAAMLGTMLVVMSLYYLIKSSAR